MSESISIPNELKITINTSIPGFQKIKYKPDMTIKSDGKGDKVVNFNPLVKLKKSVIDQVPEELRVKEFFSKGLFNSLINLHGLQRLPTLSKATKEGYVDNNIQVTLDTIFPLGSVIYVNKKPYVIGDIQWTKGNWKLDTKIVDTPVLESSKITNPYLYSRVIQNELISGEKELQRLPNSVIYGDNFDDSTASGRKIVNVPITPTITPVTPTITPVRPTIPPATPTIRPITTPKPIIPPPPPAPILPPPIVLSEDELNYDIPIVCPYVRLPLAQEPSNFLKEYFKFKSNNNKDYYFIENMIFKNLDVNYQTLFKKILQKTTITNVSETTQNISTAAYKQIVDGLKVIENSAGGDCFFIAVADAINYYNYSNPNKKIIYTNYGTDSSQLFTTHALRTMVSNYVINDPNLSDILTNVIQVNVDFLNDEFKRDIEGKLANGIMTDRNDITQYIDSVNNIYKNNDNYLIDKIQNIPTDITNDDIYFKPYSILNTRQQMKDYIESPNYWANSVAIDVMASILSLSIIVIERNSQNILEIPYQTLNKNSNCDKYLFLYKYGAHYELITFDYTFKIIKENSKTKTITRKNTIFQIKEHEYLPPHFLPPDYILFLIFGTYYFKLADNSDKIDFLLYPEIFNAMNYSFDRIYNSSEKSEFLDIFQHYFPINPSSEIARRYPELLPPQAQPIPIPPNQTRRRRRGQPINNIPLRQSRRIRRLQPSINNTTGGANYVKPYQRPYQKPYQTPYQRPYQAPYIPYKSPTNFIKKEDPYEKSNISYYITIDMELKQGTEVSKKEIGEMKCNQRWNSVKKSYADLMGLKYVIKPVYSSSSSNKKGVNQKEDKNYTRKITL